MSEELLGFDSCGNIAPGCRFTIVNRIMRRNIVRKLYLRSSMVNCFRVERVMLGCAILVDRPGIRKATETSGTGNEEEFEILLGDSVVEIGTEISIEVVNTSDYSAVFNASVLFGSLPSRSLFPMWRDSHIRVDQEGRVITSETETHEALDVSGVPRVVNGKELSAADRVRELGVLMAKLGVLAPEQLEQAAGAAASSGLALMAACLQHKADELRKWKRGEISSTTVIQSQPPPHADQPVTTQPVPCPRCKARDDIERWAREGGAKVGIEDQYEL
jgi:hypothetical protein